jgi:lipopolysaccharide exporter
VVLPRRALAGSIGGKALEAGTLAGLVLLVPRALGPADYGSFAVALAVATGLSTATGVGGPSLFARALGPLDGAQRDELARALTRRLGVARSRLVAVVVLAACGGAALAPHRVSMLQAALVLGAVAFGSAATLLSQLALGLERTVAWSLRYPLENGVIVGAALVLYPLAGLNGAIAAIALGAIAAFGLGLATVGRSLLTAPEGGRRALPASVVRFARLQAAAGLLSQTVQRGAAPACALLGVGATATGHAAIAAGAALAIVFAVTQTTLVVLPGAARTFALDPARARALLCHVALVATAVVVPVCIVVAVAADRLLALTLGDPFRGAAPALRIALAAAALAPAWALSMQLAAVGDQPEAVLTGAAAGAATFVVVAALALPGGGAVAGAEAMVAGFGVSVLATLAALRVMAVGRH